MMLDGREAAKIRRLCGAPGARCPVYVVAGGMRPTLRGRAGHSVFKNGGECEYPGSARRAGCKVLYVRSTLECFVGADWWAAYLEAPEYLPEYARRDWVEERVG